MAEPVIVAADCPLPPEAKVMLLKLIDNFRDRVADDVIDGVVMFASTASGIMSTAVGKVPMSLLAHLDAAGFRIGGAGDDQGVSFDEASAQLRAKHN